MIAAKVYKSLLFPATFFGLPRKFTLVIIITTFSMVFALGQLWFSFIAVILLIIGVYANKNDAYFFDIYLAAIKLPKVAD